LKNKEYIFITGSTGKLGKTICEIFAEMGENIILHYFNSDKKIKIVSQDIKKKFPKISIIEIKIDLSNLYSVNYFNKNLFNKYKIKGLVNSASFFVKDAQNIKANFLSENLNIHFRNPVALISCLINSDSKNKFAINITDKNLSESGYDSYNRSKLLLSEYSQNMNFDNEKISIKEFKPGKVLPSKNDKSSVLKFKQEFQKLIK
tara:strand:+ start:3428 stop:4039 length:612 start_codon:yes stop_codon:yes gene_type:complete